MDLFRVFDWDGRSLGHANGGPLFVARHRQGAGRHDTPLKYAAWYCSQTAASAVAESIRFWRGHRLEEDHFRRLDGLTKALVSFSIPDDVAIVDLDDPYELAARGLRPSQVATMRRAVTQRIARSIFDEGAVGLQWWSTLEAEWTNVTLFQERVIRHVSQVGRPLPLSTQLPVVREAAEWLGIAV